MIRLIRLVNILQFLIMSIFIHSYGTCVDSVHSKLINNFLISCEDHMPNQEP